MCHLHLTLFFTFDCCGIEGAPLRRVGQTYLLKIRQLRATYRFLHDALVETNKLFVLARQTQGLMGKKLLHSMVIYGA
jgi:hypothetical protein